MSIVLGIDTATQVSVGIAEVTDRTRPGRILARAQVAAANQHVEQLIPLTEQALAEAGLSYADLDEIAVGLGPGPFTGLRVGIVTGRVLASTLKLPLRGVCSLDVVASREANRILESESERPELDLIATIDARRKELYWARYTFGAVVPARVQGPEVTAPEDLPHGIVVGPGRAARPDLFGPVASDGVDAAELAAVAHLLSDAGTQPLYLRRPDATEPTRRKSALGSKETA